MVEHKDRAGRARQKELFKAIMTLKSVEECQRLFVDLCTPAELKAMSDRWLVAQMLEQEIPYRMIYEKTGVSTATITRVARCITQGEGGYTNALNKRKREKKR